MTTPSTRDRIRKRLADALETMRQNNDALQLFARGRRFKPEALRLDVEVALRLLDSLTPAVPRNPVEALRVALDYGTEREWPLDVREMVARLLPEMRIATCWTTSHPAATSRSRYHAATGAEVGRVVKTEKGWTATLPEERPVAASLEGAQADVDAQLSGWVLGGGPVTVDPDEEYDDGPVSGTSARVGLPLESEWEPQNTQPEEEQPDASWLRLVARDDRLLGVETWRYQGRPPERDASITGANAAEVLRGWLSARGILHTFDEPANGGTYEIVTRAPLDGDWCAACGENMDGARFLSSRQRIVRGEEATVCGSCAEDSDREIGGPEWEQP